MVSDGSKVGEVSEWAPSFRAAPGGEVENPQSEQDRLLLEFAMAVSVRLVHEEDDGNQNISLFAHKMIGIMVPLARGQVGQDVRLRPGLVDIGEDGGGGESTLLPSLIAGMEPGGKRGSDELGKAQFSSLARRGSVSRSRSMSSKL